jgi:hypothetical protein
MDEKTMSIPLHISASVSGFRTSLQQYHRLGLSSPRFGMGREPELAANIRGL